MKPEAKVKAAVKAKLKEHKAWYFCPVSNGMGTHGIPDFIVCFMGRFFAFECKAGNAKPTGLQRMHIDAIRHCDGIAIVINEDTIHRVEAALFSFKGEKLFGGDE